MMYTNIIDDLEVVCPVPHFFEEREHLPTVGASCCRKIAHIRADYDGRKWWNTIWPYHDELATPEIRKEVDAVYDALTSPDAFPTLASLTAFCMSHPEAKASESCSDEFNFYLDGKLCWYWLRCIMREQDYNLYLHAFLKDNEGARNA